MHPSADEQAAFLAGVFGDGRDVSYPTFLSWATPGPDGLAASGVHPHGITHVPGPSSRRQHQHPRRGPAEGALYALEGGGGKEPRNWKQLQQSDGGIRERRTGVEGEEEREREEEAELKVRTALQRMGEDGISRAWEEFENMDPGGRRGGVQEEELVEVCSAQSCGLNVWDCRRTSRVKRRNLHFLDHSMGIESPRSMNRRISSRSTTSCRQDR